MAFAGITATEAEIDQKTGAGVSASYTDTMKTAALLHAESIVNATSKYNWSDWYTATPNVDFKYIITEATASMVAVEAIKYDINSYPNILIAEDMINVLIYKIEQVMKIFADPAYVEFIQLQT